MALDSHPKYSSMEQPWWANDLLILVLALASIVIIVWDIETDLLTTNPTLWWILAVLDLVVVGFFVADLYEDYQRCIDKKWWFNHNGWELLGLVPMVIAGIPGLGAAGMLRFLRLIRVFSAIMRLLGATERAGQTTVEKQVLHLFLIVFTLILTGGFMTYVFEVEAYDECMALAEGCDVEPQITTLPDALWWAVVTSTTVGYGDYAPVTWPGRLVAVALMLIGIGLVGTLAATLSQLFYGSPSVAPTREEEVILESMERLALLHEVGNLTDGEYETGKSVLLAQLVHLEDEQLAREQDISRLPMPLQVAQRMADQQAQASLAAVVEEEA